MSRIIKFVFSLSICFLLIVPGIIAQTSNKISYPDTLNKNRLATVLSVETAAYTGGLSFLAFIWYKDHDRVSFHFYDDSKGYLQMDKAGHAYAAYYESKVSYHALRWAGLSRNKALVYGGLAGVLFQTPIEIFDGLYGGWGFSWSDMGANAIGALLFAGQEALFDDQLLRLKFSYAPSGYPKYHSILGDNPIESFFLDYNGHSYWTSLNIQGITGIDFIPPWLNIAIGYSANGMIKEFENPKYYMGKPFPYLERYRQFFLSADIDWNKIETDKKWLKIVFQMLNMIKLPFPALEYNGQNEFRFHWLYF